MTASAVRPRRARMGTGTRVARQPELDTRPPLDLDALASGWQRALDAAVRALTAADERLTGVVPGHGHRELAQERTQTGQLLAHLAELIGVPVPWLSPVPVRPTMLGLPAAIEACLFDLDGVLTDSGLLHASAWAEVFDRFLLALSAEAAWQFVPFDRDADYRAYLDGRPRLEGVHAFLTSRGIRLPEGRPDDAADADTATGLARRKSETLIRDMRHRGVTTLPGARRYLEAAGHAGLARGVISASTRTLPMLELAGLRTLLEERVDAEAIRAEGLRSRPAPDLLIAACHRLGTIPEHAVSLTHSPAGVVAGRSAGLVVIGVGAGAHAELLRGYGAERVVPSLASLLDRRLADQSPAPAAGHARRAVALRVGD